jgi:hypothetical protein
MLRCGFSLVGHVQNAFYRDGLTEQGEAVGLAAWYADGSVEAVDDLIPAGFQQRSTEYREMSGPRKE